MTGQSFAIQLTKGFNYLKEKGFRFFLLRLAIGFFYFKNRQVEKMRMALFKTCNRQTYVEREIHGLKMLLDPEDQGLTKELVLHKTREPFSIQYLKEFVGISDIVIDIGANIGLYALLEAKLATEGKVYAIEPITQNLDLLKANIEHNNLKNVEVFQQAISDRTGKGQMYTYDKRNFASFNLNENARVTGSIDVSVMTLDGFVKAHVVAPPSFIRFDVEGHEIEIIRGATDLLSGKSPLKLFIEVHGAYLGKEELCELLDVLEKNEFKVNAVFREPIPFNLRNLKILSKLEKASGGVGFGLIGASYNTVLKTALEGGLCHVFLERTLSSSFIKRQMFNESSSADKTAYKSTDATEEHVPCNLCGAENFTRKFVSADRQYRLPGKFSVVECNVCGLMYVTALPCFFVLSLFRYLGVGDFPSYRHDGYP